MEFDVLATAARRNHCHHNCGAIWNIIHTHHTARAAHPAPAPRGDRSTRTPGRTQSWWAPDA